MASPVVVTRQDIEHTPCVGVGITSRQPKQDDSGIRGKAIAKCQLAEVLVLGHDDTTFCLGSREDGPIVPTTHRFLHGEDIETRGAKPADNHSGYALVRHEAHRESLSRVGQQVDTLGFQDLARVGQAGLDVGGSQVVVLSENLFHGPPASQEIDDELHRHPCPSDDRLPDENARIDRDSL